MTSTTNQRVKKTSSTRNTANAPRPVREKLDLSHHLPFLLSQVARMLSIGASRTFQRHFGVGVREWRVIAILGDRGPASAAEMVGPAAFDKATVSRAIGRLEKLGLVERMPDRSDGRKQQVRLTDDGVDLHDSIVPLARMRAKVIESALTTQERTQFFAIINKIRVQIEWLESEERGSGASDDDDDE